METNLSESMLQELGTSIKDVSSFMKNAPKNLINKVIKLYKSNIKKSIDIINKWNKENKENK